MSMALLERRGSDGNLSGEPLPALRSRSRAGSASIEGLGLDDREDVLLADDEKLVLVDLELGPRVLRVEDLVADLDVDGFALAVVEDAARADGQDLALLRLLLGGVREDDAALGHLLTRRGLDHDPVAQRAKLRRGCGGGGQRPFLLGRRTSPSLLDGLGRRIRDLR